MEKFAVRITYPSGYTALMTAGNHFGKNPNGDRTPPVAPFYGREEAEEFAIICARNRMNDGLTFTAVPYPADPYDNR